jgi:Protein of unknown function (DUF1236)
MRKSLLGTATAMATIAWVTVAMAQGASTEPGKGNTQPQAGQSHTGAPGGLKGPGGAVGQAEGAKPLQGGAMQQKGAQQTGPEQHQFGQNRTEQNSAQEKRGPENGTQNRENSAQEHGPQNTTTGAATENSGGQHAVQGKAAGGTSVKLSEEQRTKIQRIIVGNKSVARLDHPSFSVTVGATIPKTVHVAVLPEEIVSIVPEYRGFDYILVGDQILIIDPESLEIVDIIPA